MKIFAKNDKGYNMILLESFAIFFLSYIDL